MGIFELIFLWHFCHHFTPTWDCHVNFKCMLINAINKTDQINNTNSCPWMWMVLAVDTALNRQSIIYFCCVIVVLWNTSQKAASMFLCFRFWDVDKAGVMTIVGTTINQSIIYFRCLVEENLHIKLLRHSCFRFWDVDKTGVMTIVGITIN